MTKSATKKVLFTSHTANFSKFNRPFMRWFKEQGYEVHYASAAEEEVLDCDKQFAIPFARNPLKFSNIRAYKNLKALIDKEDYTLIHTHTPMGGVITRLAAIQARKKNTRVMYTAHGFHFFKGAPLLNWIIYYPIERILAKHTDILVTINKEDYELAHGTFATSVRYIPGVGIDQDKFDQPITKADRQTLRSAIHLSMDDFVMIYLAEISDRKNQMWLIKALEDTLKQHPHMHLILAGKDSLNGKCQQLVHTLGLDNNIHFLGYREDTAKLLNSSDLALSSSLQEGLPVNIMEAMYAKLPIVATDCRGNRDLIKDGESGYNIINHNQYEFNERVLEFYRDKRKRLRIGLNGRRSVSAYLPSHVMEAQSHIYKEVL